MDKKTDLRIKRTQKAIIDTFYELLEEKNFANITIDGATTRTVRVGGITGLAYKGEDPAPVIKNCTNYGNVVNNAVGTAGSNSYLAGVIAVWESNGVAMDGLVNYGSIINNGANCRFVGGVCACVSRNIWVQNCKNYGEVKDCITAADRHYHVGGIGIDSCFFGRLSDKK